VKGWRVGWADDGVKIKDNKVHSAHSADSSLPPNSLGKQYPSWWGTTPDVCGRGQGRGCMRREGTNCSICDMASVVGRSWHVQAT